MSGTKPGPAGGAAAGTGKRLTLEVRTLTGSEARACSPRLAMSDRSGDGFRGAGVAVWMTVSDQARVSDVKRSFKTLGLPETGVEMVFAGASKCRRFPVLSDSSDHCS